MSLSPDHVLLRVEDLIENFVKAHKAPDKNIERRATGAVTALTGVAREDNTFFVYPDTLGRNIFFLPQLLVPSEEHLKKNRGMGPKKMRLIKEAVGNLGYALEELAGNADLQRLRVDFFEVAYDRRKKTSKKQNSKTVAGLESMAVERLIEAFNLPSDQRPSEGRVARAVKEYEKLSL